MSSAVASASFCSGDLLPRRSVRLGRGSGMLSRILRSEGASTAQVSVATILRFRRYPYVDRGDEFARRRLADIDTLGGDALAVLQMEGRADKRQTPEHVFLDRLASR